MGIETLFTNAGARRTLRRLELEAYAAVVSAFRAQGPLTGEKKVSLETLCKHLGISAERHRAEIRRAVNDELLSSVAECISGMGTETAWRREGQKLASTNPRFVARQVTHLPQVIASATVSAVLGMQAGKPEIEAKKATSAQVQNALKFIISQNPTISPKPTHPLSHTQPGTKPKAASPTHVTATVIPSSNLTEPTSTTTPVKSLSLPLSLAAAKAAATQSTQTVSTGVQTLSASSPQALQPIANTPVDSKYKEKPLLVNQTTETSNTFDQEPKTAQPKTPEQVDSKPTKLEEPSSNKLPLLGCGEMGLGLRGEQMESAGVAAQQEPVQASVAHGEAEKCVETLGEVLPPSDKEQGVPRLQGDGKLEDSLRTSPVDSQPSTLPSPVQIPPKMDTSTSTRSPETSTPTATSTTTATTTHSVSKTIDLPSTLPFQKPTPLVVVATPASGSSRAVPPTPVAVPVVPLPIPTSCSSAPTPTTRTHENRKRPLTPTSLPPPAKKPAPPLLTPTPSTPHLPIPALTRISVHTDVTMSSAPTVDTTANSPSTDFSHKRRYPPPPLVHAGCDPPPPLLHASSVALPDTTTKPLKPTQPTTALEQARGEVQLRTLLQGTSIATFTPGVERIPPSVSIPPLPAVTPQVATVTSSPPPHPPASTLPLPTASLRTPSPTPSNTDAFIQALCSDPSLEDSTVSALATQLGLDFIDPGILAGSDLLQFMQPIDTEPVLTASSAAMPMDTQQPVHIPHQPVSTDKPLQIHSSSRGFVEAVKASPTTVPSGQFGLLMSPVPHTPLQVSPDHIGMFSELCLQPAGETNTVIPDLGSLSSSTDESDLLEGIPQELAETIQALARLDEQSTTAYSPMQ